MKKMDIIQRGKPGLLKRGLIFATITWVPLAILTLIDGTVAGESVTLISIYRI